VKVGDYVKMNDSPRYAYIQGFMTWVDEVGEYDMVELLMDDGCTVETAPDEYQLVNKDNK